MQHRASFVFRQDNSSLLLKLSAFQTHKRPQILPRQHCWPLVELLRIIIIIIFHFFPNIFIVNGLFPHYCCCCCTGPAIPSSTVWYDTADASLPPTYFCFLRPFFFFLQNLFPFFFFLLQNPQSDMSC
jgi:hypothetical protein